MSDPGQLTEIVADKYKNLLLDQWEAIASYRVEVRRSFIQRNMDAENITYYVSLLQGLWLDLYPKAQGNDKLKPRFEKFKSAFEDPFELLADPEKIFELELLLREALELLGITVIERVS